MLKENRDGGSNSWGFFLRSQYLSRFRSSYWCVDITDCRTAKKHEGGMVFALSIKTNQLDVILLEGACA
jgi:hypothetical protein